jgi:hypothetical protein
MDEPTWSLPVGPVGGCLVTVKTLATVKTQ